MLTFLLVALIGSAANSADDVPHKHFPIPCRLDGIELGEIDGSFTNANKLLSIDGVALLDWLKPVVIPDVWTKLQASLDGDKRLSLGALSATGLGLEYDAAALQVTLSIPAEVRQRVDLRLGSGGPRQPVTPPLASSRLSGYINFRAGRTYVSSSQGLNKWEPFTFDLDGAISFLNTSVEGVGIYRAGQGSGWSRGDVRLVHDFPDRRLRVTAGDISYSLSGFQSFQRAGGITVGRDFGLQPYRSSAPSGLTTVLLDRRSNVDIMINGQRAQTLNLGPGQYNVRDFPFTSGSNDVTLRITDDVGRQQVVNFPFVYDSTVLGAGEHDFQYAFGFAARATQSGRAYDTSRPVGSMYHALGLNDQVTLGLNFQGDDEIKTAGLEARWATFLGTFRADLAGSTARGVANGYAARLTYRYVETNNPHSRGRSFEFSGIYRSPTFTTLGMLPTRNPIAADIGARYGQKLFGGIYGSIGYSYQMGRAGTRDSHDTDISLSTTFWKNINAYVLASQTKPAIGKVQNRIFFAISWFPQGKGYSVTATEDTYARNSQLQFHYAPNHIADSFEVDATLEHGPNQTFVRGDANYTGYRFTADVSQFSTFRDSETGPTEHRTALTAGTAIAFADGHFAVSRPISDSFLLVTRHPSLAGHRVEVNSFATVPEARTDFLGTAVLPDILSYYRYQVLLAADLPEGLDLGREFYVVEPRYRSGAVVRAGTGATVLLQAVLLDMAKRPLGLELGTITMDDFPEVPPIDFFTDRAGFLRVAGIRPGRLTVQLSNYPEAPYHLTIPAKVVGRYYAGEAVLEVEPEGAGRANGPQRDVVEPGTGSSSSPQPEDVPESAQ